MYKNYQYELFSTSWVSMRVLRQAVDRLNKLLPIEGRLSIHK